ncbi:MAG TPA: PepSY-like domain-containing protein [Gemmatimonadales bacterium]|nr:PepSY-like domain-containing protein [Gemmatimonadales bacterium]
MPGRSLVTVLILLLTAGAGPARAQHRDTLPTAIATVFRTAYPDAKILNVSRERRAGKVVYEIESQDGPTRRDLIYDLAGRNLETEEVIPADSVPAEVRAAVQRDVAGGTIVNAERVTREKVILYEVGVRHGGKTRYLTYDPMGKRVE